LPPSESRSTYLRCSYVIATLSLTSNLLRLLNCDEMQRYLFSKPLSAEIFEAKYLVQRIAVQTRDVD
jgi:hypothetical protein